MQVIFSDSAYAMVVFETINRIKTETGGVFLGYYENETWYAIETIAPGPKAVFQSTYFEYDQKYVTRQINKIAQMYRAKLSLIGFWHKHPGSFNEFSSTDDVLNSDYAKLSDNGAISVLVNIEPDFHITSYHVAYPLRYTKIAYKVGNNLIPSHLLQLKIKCVSETVENQDICEKTN